MRMLLIKIWTTTANFLVYTYTFLVNRIRCFGRRSLNINDFFRRQPPVCKNSWFGNCDCSAVFRCSDTMQAYITRCKSGDVSVRGGHGKFKHSRFYSSPHRFCFFLCSLSYVNCARCKYCAYINTVIIFIVLYLPTDSRKHIMKSFPELC